MESNRILGVVGLAKDIVEIEMGTAIYTTKTCERLFWKDVGIRFCEAKKG